MKFLYVLSLLIIGFTITFGTVILPGKPTPLTWKQCDSMVEQSDSRNPSGSCVNQVRKGQPVYVDRQGPWCKWCPNIGKSVRTTLMLSFLYLPKIPWIPSNVSTWLIIYERGVKRAWFSQLGDCPGSILIVCFFYVVNFLAVISVIYYIFLHVWGASCSTAAGLSNHTPCPLLATRGSMPSAADQVDQDLKRQFESFDRCFGSITCPAQNQENIRESNDLFFGADKKRA